LEEAIKIEPKAVWDACQNRERQRPGIRFNLTNTGEVKYGCDGNVRIEEKL
jgi:hypothetical protein